MSKINEKFITDVNLFDIQKRYQPSKHYVYCILVTWNDQSKNIIYRRYSQFFDLQCKLLDKFDKDAGSNRPEERILPFLPGKIIFGRSNIRSVALDRLYPLNAYCKKLISLKKEISTSDFVIEFFEMKNDDIEQSVKGHNRDKKPNTQTQIEMTISQPIKTDEYIVIHDFKGNSKTELSIKKNTKVFVVEKNLSGWWFVENNDGQGYVPGNCLKKINNDINDLQPIKVELPEPHIVTKDYNALKADELSVKKATYVLVIEKNLNGFWRIRMGDKEGLLPAVYLRPHTFLNEKLKETLNLVDHVNNNTKDLTQPPNFSKNSVNEQLVATDKTEINETNSEENFDNLDQEKPNYYYSIDKYVDNAGDGVNLEKGQRVSVLRRDYSTNWWYVKLDDSTEGWAPGTYMIKKLPDKNFPILETDKALSISNDNKKENTENNENVVLKNESDSQKSKVSDLLKIFEKKN